MMNSAPTLLTLPVEIRSHIFHLVLLNTPEICASDPPYRRSLDLSVLSTNRQIYYETRDIPLALHDFGKPYDPNVNFISSLRLRPFQVAALKTLVIEYLSPSDLKQFLALGSDNGYVLGESALDLDQLIIYADDWIAKGARRWRYATSPEDVQYGLPRSSRWLRALCGLKGWKQLNVGFKVLELVNEYWDHGGFMQQLFDDFRSHSGNMGVDFTIWHESSDRPYEMITILRTKELGRFKQHRWWRVDLRRLMEGKECVSDESMDTNDDERERLAFHLQERLGGPGKRQNQCIRCQT